MRLLRYAALFLIFLAAAVGTGGHSGAWAANARLDGWQLSVIEHMSEEIASGTLPDDKLYHAFRLRGEAHAELGQYEQAIEDYEAAMRVRPGYFAIYLFRADAYERQGNDEAALADYTTVLETRPDHIFAMHGRGKALHNLGRYEEALAAYNQALALAPTEDDFLASRSATYAKLGNYRAAFDDIDAAIGSNPDHGDHYVARGRLHEARGNRDEAIADYTTAVGVLAGQVQTYWKDGMRAERDESTSIANFFYRWALEQLAILSEVVAKLDRMQSQQ